MNWTDLTTIGQLKEVLAGNTPEFAIFKHSTRCSISRMVKDRLERKWSPEAPFPVLYLDLLRYREVSDAVAREFDIVHESPQLIVVKNNRVVYHSSHHDISPEEAAQA